mmetsp:Transcript_47462/g.94762  ORF Transcript_47462/g.94762 Transcript_47462/m.94762 type:complete len:239 (-) Transcript_47462:388-1104(-)
MHQRRLSSNVQLKTPGPSARPLACAPDLQSLLYSESEMVAPNLGARGFPGRALTSATKFTVDLSMAVSSARASTPLVPHLPRRRVWSESVRVPPAVICASPSAGQSSDAIRECSADVRCVTERLTERAESANGAPLAETKGAVHASTTEDPVVGWSPSMMTWSHWRAVLTPPRRPGSPQACAPSITEWFGNGWRPVSASTLICPIAFALPITMPTGVGTIPCSMMPANPGTKTAWALS